MDSEQTAPEEKEPVSLDEIREAWKVCLEQSSLYGAAQRYEDRGEISAESLADACSVGRTEIWKV